MADVSGFKEYMRKVRLAALATAWEQVVAEADKIAADMKARAPRGKTGNLQQSIRTEPDIARLRVLIRAGGPLTTVPVRSGQTASYDYSHAVEWGTQKASAEPFFYPTWRKDRPGSRRRINKAVKQVIEAVR